MAWLLGFIGLVLGVWAGVAGAWAVGLLGGMLIGGLTGAWMSLRERVNHLEGRVRMTEAMVTAARQAQARPAQASGNGFEQPAARATEAAPASNQTEPASAAEPEHEIAPSIAAAAEQPIESVLSEAAATVTPAPKPEATATPIAARVSRPEIASIRIPLRASDDADADADAEQVAQDTHEQVAARNGNGAIRQPGKESSSGFWRWLGEGNWVAKAGIGLLFIGAGALFKYAASEGWLSFPIEYRYIGVALAALVGLTIGWRQRHQRPVFALNLQGGAIGILLLTTYSAYRLHQLLPSSVTFAILLALVASCAVLAVLQDSLGLAVFGIIGGFAAPILVSTGSGNHVTLFSYYAMLNLAIIAISWSKGWRVLNVLGFLFTFVIGTIWGVQRYEPELFASTEPFLILFFVMYLVIPLLPALRNPDPDTRDRVDGSLVFGTPLIGFGLQAALLENDRTGLAWSALVLAAVYLGLAFLVWRHAGLARWRKAYAGLSLVFATLAVPLALSAQWTSAVWAVEGALLVWLGLDQDERRLRWSGLALQAFGGGALLFALADHWPAHREHAFAFGAVLVSLSGLFCAIQYQRRREDVTTLPWMLAGWSFVWWYVAGMYEIDRHASEGRETDIALVFIGLTAAAGALLRRYLSFRPFGWPGQFGLLMALPFVAITTLAHGTPLADDAWISWLVYFLASLITLRWLDRDGSPGVRGSHAIWWLAMPLILWLEIRDWLDTASTLGEGWRIAALSVPVLLPLALLWKRVALAGAPVRDGIESLRSWLTPLFALAAVILAVAILGMSGSSAPLPWLPILNPLELTQIAALILVMRYLAEFSDKGNAQDGLRPIMLAFGFLALSASTLRMTHHFGGEAWELSMLGNALPQSALSIVWTLSGITAMLIGARRLRRSTWIAGASVLGLVLAKLLIIDMRFLGELWGIVSLLGVGGLFVAVGYFAPMPPRETDAEPS